MTTLNWFRKQICSFPCHVRKSSFRCHVTLRCLISRLSCPTQHLGQVVFFLVCLICCLFLKQHVPAMYSTIQSINIIQSLLILRILVLFSKTFLLQTEHWQSSLLLDCRYICVKRSYLLLRGIGHQPRYIQSVVRRRGTRRHQGLRYVHVTWSHVWKQT